VVLDFKGTQFRGTIYPSATAMVVTVVNTKDENSHHLKVDNITDEFCHMLKMCDTLDKFTVDKTGNFEGYRIEEEDVNRQQPHLSVAGERQKSNDIDHEKAKPSKRKPIHNSSASKRRRS